MHDFNPGQFRKFVILFDEGVNQIREINVSHEIRSSNYSVKKFSVY